MKPARISLQLQCDQLPALCSCHYVLLAMLDSKDQSNLLPEVALILSFSDMKLAGLPRLFLSVCGSLNVISYHNPKGNGGVALLEATDNFCQVFCCSNEERN